MALNTALCWQRDEHRWRKRQQPVLEVSELAGGNLAGADQAAQRESVERLYGAIRQLPKADAAIILLFSEELSYREMAEVLAITESRDRRNWKRCSLR